MLFIFTFVASNRFRRFYQRSPLKKTLKRRFAHLQEGLEWDNDVRKGLASLAAKPQVAEFVVAGIWRLTHN